MKKVNVALIAFAIFLNYLSTNIISVNPVKNEVVLSKFEDVGVRRILNSNYYIKTTKLKGVSDLSCDGLCPFESGFPLRLYITPGEGDVLDRISLSYLFLNITAYFLIVVLFLNTANKLRRILSNKIITI